MQILRFTLENHQSFRDEASISLVDESLKTATPPDGRSWVDYTRRVAAIYGPNASGKSALLDGLQFMRSVIQHSATRWSENKRLPQRPFLLDENSRFRPSTYMLDFVLEEVRYQYGFTFSTSEIKEEWLYSYPTGRKRILFERGIDGEDLKFGRALKGGEVMIDRLTGQRELTLSRGAVSKNPQLKRIYDAIVEGMEIAEFGDANRQERLRRVTADVAEGALEISDLLLMLKVADIGIMSAEVATEEMPKGFQRVFQAILSIVRTEVASRRQDGDTSDDADSIITKGPGGTYHQDAISEMSEDELQQISEQLARALVFNHTGVDGNLYPLPSNRQSTGTLTWLSLAAPALSIIRRGGVLWIDEIDSSLHPQLAQVLIQMFENLEINRMGAQIVFTTHDTYFMSPSAANPLKAQDIWLVEKGRDGASKLYSVADFSLRSEQNFARRYLHGRYGAIPSVAPTFLAGIWHDDAPAEIEN
ncbi:AAA family ATPase [Kribbella sp. NPDC005582]|uniref:AAA family ATPase n=1 Tax=Kribbella sp. NPDC005582 TaxID=3156893 RepID=UPI00339E661E